MMMNQSLAYQPWGNPVASGIFSTVFAFWIGTANLFLIVLFITNPHLLNSRLLGSRISRTVANVLFGLVFVLLWSYLIAIGIYLSNSRNADVHIEIAPEISCRGLMASDRTYIIDLLVYYLPASLVVILLGMMAIREKMNLTIPRTQLQLDSITDEVSGMSLTVLAVVTGLTILLALPSFVTTSLMVRGDSCHDHSCYMWLTALSALSDWLLLAKSGILPLLLIFSVGEFRLAVQGVLHTFRRLPTSDERDLVSRMEDASSDDAPFSTV